MKRKAAAGALASVLIALVCVTWSNLGALVLFVVTPGVAFTDEVPPQAPDYRDAASWSALPDRDDAGDLAPIGSPAAAQAGAPADVFYVHPTSYVGPRWNAAIDDATVNTATDHGATGIQATAFNACCAVYAPRYRQANLTAFLTRTPDAEAAVALAYEDVKRAFLDFQMRRGPDRPFLLVAHSQGTVLAARLLDEEIASSPLRDQLVAAWLIGGAVTIDDKLPACATATDTGCTIAWNARGLDYVPTRFEMVRTNEAPRLCTNPLTWRDDGAAAPDSANLGAVFLDSDDFAIRPAFADAQCVDGVLVVREIGHAPRDLPSRVLDSILGPANFHPIEFQMYFMNLRENASARVDAFLRR